MFVNILGHLAYILIVLGMLLIAKKQATGWIVKIFGDFLWIVIGIKIGMSSIYFWEVIFICLNIYGWCQWQKEKV